MDVLVPATPDSLGYTRHICIDCNYSYLSDYVTSGDIGYIPEPEEPEIPEVHKHSYEIQTMDDSENMSVIVMRVCACGDVKNGYYNVSFTNDEGEVTEFKETGNKIDYSAMFGQVVISIADENCEQLKTVAVTAQEKTVDSTIPDEPPVPDEPSTPDEPKQPYEPTEPTNPEEPNQPDDPSANELTTPDEPNADISESKKGGNGVAIALFVILIVLALGGVGGFIAYKKIKAKRQK